MLTMATLTLGLHASSARSSQLPVGELGTGGNRLQENSTSSAEIDDAVATLHARTIPPPCPCGAAALCKSLEPQPSARAEVLAFHTPSFYTNPATEHELEPFYFRHYNWSHVTTVASFVGSEGLPGHEEPDWDTSGYTRELVCTAHQNNARMVAHIGHGAPTWPELLNSTWRTVWVGQIVDWFITKQGMDGVQFDVEDLQPQFTSAATDLVCELRHALTVALPGSTLSWCSDSPVQADPGYNFTRLSSCIDYFVVMEYAHGLGPAWQTSFENGLQSYAAVDVPPSKLVYTLPWFGVQWVCQELSGVNCTPACYYRGELCNTTINGARPISQSGYAEIVEFATTGLRVHYQPQLTPSPYVDAILNGTDLRTRYEYDDPRYVLVNYRDSINTCHTHP